jgi:hypothetical protein
LKDSLPHDVRQFLLDHIESVEAITVLLLVYAEPARQWTAQEVGRESRTNDWSAGLQLEALSARGLFRSTAGPPPTYQADGRHAQAIATLGRTFRERRVAVITFIYNRPDEVGESSADPLQAFADAFKLRKDK